MLDYVAIIFAFLFALGLAALLLALPKVLAPKMPNAEKSKPFEFPWAVLFREMGIFGLLEMALFMGFVVLGFFYVWKKKALEWG
jgi:NADH:ubiquinone oxidoreductase subunit 3 (subunit A)